MQRFIIGLDNGTTGVKAKLYDLTGATVAESYHAYSCLYPKPGWVEQDIRMLAKANEEALSDLVTHSGVNPNRIVSLGLSSQRGLHLYLDKDGQVLRGGLGISWQDARHAAQLDWMRSTVGEEPFYRTTGLPISAFWPVGKIRWMMEHEPETMAQAKYILSTQEYFLHHLGARDGWYLDWSNASLFGLMDVRSFQWSEPLLSQFGIAREMLPELVPPGTQVGVVDRAAHERTGLPIGLPICTGGGDQQCAGIGAGVISKGLCELTLGTAGNSVAYIEKPIFDPAGKITCSAHALPMPGWEAEGIQAAAGASYRWFRDAVGHVDMQSHHPQADPYLLLNQLAAQEPIGSNGLLFHPYLAGAMTPHYDPNARGGFIGLTLKHGTGAMARAVLEGVAFEAKDTLDAYAAMGLELDEIRLAGGATRSPLWCQIQADVYGRPTVLLREGECAVLGAAILGAVGAGVFGSVAEACAQMVHPMATYEPRPTAHALYSELHGIHRSIYATLESSGVYEALARFQARHS